MKTLDSLVSFLMRSLEHPFLLALRTGDSLRRVFLPQQSLFSGLWEIGFKKERSVRALPYSSRGVSSKVVMIGFRNGPTSLKKVFPFESNFFKKIDLASVNPSSKQIVRHVLPGAHQPLSVWKVGEA